MAFQRLIRNCMAIAMGMGLGLAALSAPAVANPFAPAIKVNDRVITRFELDQRLLFLQILRQPGDLEEQARTGLIEDRLRMFAAEEFGIKLTPEQVLAGMEEFAARANLPVEEFLKIVNGMGLQTETYRDFVEAGLVWREVVRAKYAGKVSITEAEVDRALALFKPTTAVRVLLSELVLPASGADRSTAMALARRLQSQISDEASFAAAARGNSAAPSAGSGGRLAWQRLSVLPEAAIPEVRRLAVGQVSDPVVLDDTVVLYFLRELGEDKLGSATTTVVDYAQFLLPDGPEAAAELASLRAKVDSCIDLMAAAKDLPAERLLRDSQPQGEVPGDIAAVLATLDPGESSTQLRRGGWRVFLMLCSRGPSSDLLPPRDQAREQLLNQRLGALAEIFMEELRAEAIITEP